MIRREHAAWVAVAAPPAAALIAVVAGVETPGYDWTERTVSRLAAPGLPWAAAVDLAIGLVAVACVSLAVSLPTSARTSGFALMIAGAGFAVAALVHLDPASLTTTTLHRLASGVAVGGIVVAAVASGRTYGRISTLFGAAEFFLVAVAAPLLTTTFNVWGAWERLLLFCALAWIVRVAWKIVSSDEIASAASARYSSHARYAPARKVTSANR